MKAIALVALGGALGSVARHLVAVALPPSPTSGFPAGTLAVNLIGSFLVAFVAHAAGTRALVSADARLFLVTGVLGGFTTYSSFNQETVGLALRGAPLLAAGYMTLTGAGALLAGLGGLMTARLLLG